MFLQHITIENFGAVQFYDRKFAGLLELLETRHTQELSAAIGLLLCRRTSFPESWVQECTRISGRVCLNDADYDLSITAENGLQLTATDRNGNDVTNDYCHTLLHCPEQEDIEHFDGLDSAISSRLSGYFDPEDSHALSQNTQDLSRTTAFRKALNQYVRNFQPESICCGKSYLLTLSPQGVFQPQHPQCPGPIYLSETENKLFSYLCFLNIAAFWEEIQCTRDLHHEKKPLMIQNFLEHLDESADIQNLLERTLSLRRQVLIFTSPLQQTVKENWFTSKP